MNVASDVIEEDARLSRIAVSADVNQYFYTSMAGVSLPFYLHLFSFFILTILPIRTGVSITQLHRAQRELRGREERGRVTEHHALSSLNLLHLFFAVSCTLSKQTNE